MSTNRDPANLHPDGESPASGERRRLLRGGLAAGSVLMTVTSRPVLGQVACSPSAATSLNVVSSHTHTCFTAQGLSPDQWESKVPDWPSPYLATLAPASNCTPAPATPAPVQAPTPAPQTNLSILDRLRQRASGSRTITTSTTTPSTTVSTPVAVASSSTSSTCAPTTTQTAPPVVQQPQTKPGTILEQLRLRAGGSTVRTTGTTSSQVTLGSASTRITAPAAPLQHSSTTTSAPLQHSSTTTSASSGTILEQLQFRANGGRSTTPAPAPAPATPITPVAATAPSGDNTPFHGGVTGLGGSTYGQMSMLDVLGKTSSDSIGRYVVAALLNAKSGRSPMLPEATVRNMWNDLINRGYYEATAGIHWGEQQVVAYIKTTIA